MFDYPRWKVWAISLTVLLGILFALPNMVPADVRAKWPSFLPSSTISLGLDLAGGSQLLLEADIPDAERQRLQAMEDQVSTELRRDPRIEVGDVSIAGGRVALMVRDPAKVDAAVERLRTLTQPVGLTGSRDWDVQVMDSSRIMLTPTASGSQRALRDAMTVARDVVRRRI
ncbi:MAG: protein translocase subunit SecD, partial [Pseudomonadota bacterium]|nr:protein translocase subunit SecD [Pseudomonadota bacterium]